MVSLSWLNWKDMWSKRPIQSWRCFQMGLVRTDSLMSATELAHKKKTAKDMQIYKSIDMSVKWFYIFLTIDFAFKLKNRHQVNNNE